MVGPRGASSTRSPDSCVDEVVVDLVRVERAAGALRGRRSSCSGLQPERQADVAELEVEVDDTVTLCPALGER